MNDAPPAGSADDRDPGLVRVSDAERQHVADLLRDAAAEGRLELDELEERLEAAYGARVAAELVPLVADLPTGLSQPQPPARPVQGRPVPTGNLPRHTTSVACLGGRDRRGAWEVGDTHTALVLMGGADVDLREARFTAPETVITAVAVMGGIDIVVGPDVRLSVEGLGIMGSFGEATPHVDADLRPDSPVVRVRGLALMGAVEVHRKPPTDLPRGEAGPAELG